MIEPTTFTIEKLTREDFEQILKYYYEAKLGKTVDIKIELTIENKEAVMKCFYVVDNEEKQISKEEIREILIEYVAKQNGLLDSYQIIKAARFKENNPEYEKDMPVFTNVYLYYDKLSKMKK